MTLEFAAARLNMVENQVRTNDVTDLDIQDAMRVVPREDLCPPDKRYLAYAEVPIEYAPGWFLMQPRDVSKLLQALFPRPGERALALAAPYAAAVMRRIGLVVEERSGPEIGEIPAGGEWDVMITEAAVAEAPAVWGERLAVNGRLAFVERSGPVGKAKLVTRSPDGVLARRDLFDSTPHYAPGFEPRPAFTF